MRTFRKCFRKDFTVFSDALYILHPISYAEKEKARPLSRTRLSYLLYFCSASILSRRYFAVAPSIFSASGINSRGNL